MNRLDRPSLPVFAIGAGALHLIALALLLPLLITLPGPGSDAPPKPVNIEVNLGSSTAPEPVVPDLAASPSVEEQTSALPPAAETKDETPDALADVAPDSEPSTEDEPEAAPVKAKPSAKSMTATPKAKPKVQVKPAKPAPKVVRQAPQRKSLFARGKPSKPLFGGGTAPRSKSQGPSWSALLNSAPSAADAKR